MDFVVMNPPFGTKSNESVFECFLQKAKEISKGPIYVLHKTNFYGIKNLAINFCLNTEVLFDYDY